MKKVRFKEYILMLALSSTFLLACHRDEINKDTPAWHIVASENLAIPVAIDLPANLPGGNTRVATFYAIGVQKYKAQPKAGSNPVTYEWVFVAPQADLYDVTNAKIGTHSAGPTWQLFSAADSIFGQQFTPSKSAPSPDPNNIDWLQLMSKAGKTPTGIFANVSYIQRIATFGGKAPITLPVGAGQTIDVAYSAVYRFIKKNP